MWRPSGVTPVQPPIKKKPLDRPKKKRAREPNEPTSRRVGISKQCKTCGKLGHNRRSYKGEIGGNSSLPGTTNRTSTSNKVIYGHIWNTCFPIFNINVYEFIVCKPACIASAPLQVHHLNSACIAHPLHFRPAEVHSSTHIHSSTAPLQLHHTN